MKTKTIDLYEFDELSDDAKAKVLENERWINVDSDHWYDYDGKTGFSSAEIKKYRLELGESDDLLTYKKLYFDTDRAWYIQFVGAEFKHDETARKYLGVPRDLWNRVGWHINDCPSRDGSTRLEYEDYEYSTGRDFTPKQIEILDRAVERFADKVEEALKGLRNSYEYETSDEAVIDTIKANEYTFTANGKMENA